MKVTLIVRVLDADDALLGWGKVEAQAKGDRCLWAVGPCVIAVAAAGEAVTVSVHWPDLHVQRRAACQAILNDPSTGSTLTLEWRDAIMRFESDDGPLPAVTVGQTTVSVPTRVLGAVGISVGG